MKNKALVAFFSASGVTRAVAKSLAKAANADLFEILPETPYSSADLDWTNKQSRSTIEMNDPAFRPAIAKRLSNMDEYDTLFVGFPIWWYIAPSIINTFLESYDLSGKTVIPFATSGSSGMGDTEKVLKALCPQSVVWKKGKRLDAHADETSLKAWIKELDI